MSTRARSIVFLVAFATLALLSTGCVTAKLSEPMRAVWVTRFDYKTPADVVKIMDDCAGGGFNAVLFQVRGNGTAFYDSSYEPWAEQFGFEDPGFDPLALACEEAHARGLELHAWVNVMPAWRGDKPPADPNQLYHTHPEWFWYDQYGQRQKLSWFYVSLNPCLPEVRQYLVDVFREIVADYDVDGLHLDYIRFPNEPPATPKGTDIDYPHDERTLALFKQETGLTPEEDPVAWNRWRSAQVTRLVGAIHDMVHRTRADAVLTAAVGSVHKRALSHFQDSKAWMEGGHIDGIILMNYHDDPQVVADRIDAWMVEKPPVPVVPGLWFGRHREKTTEEAAQVVQRQIEIALEKTGNFCLFAYASLFTSADKDELSSRDEKTLEQRRIRQAVLLPYLRDVAAGE